MPRLRSSAGLQLARDMTGSKQGCIFFYNSPPPSPRGERNQRLLGLGKKIKEGSKRREGKGKEKGKGKGRKSGKEEKEKKTKGNEGGKNMRGKELKKADKEANAKELRNFGISLIIHDRRLSGVYILI